MQRGLPHRIWHVHNVKPTFEKTCLHRLFPAQNSQPKSGFVTRIAFGLHIVFSLGQAWRARFAFGVQNMVNIIRRGFPASHLVWTQVTRNERGLPTSTSSYTCQSSNVKRGLTTSSVAYTHLSADDQHGFRPSFLAYKKLFGDILYNLSTSFLAKVFKHLM